MQSEKNDTRILVEGPAWGDAGFYGNCEMKLEHSGGVRAMIDEQIERSIGLIKEMLAQREAGANAKVIERRQQ